MLELFQLEQLVAFADSGTLSKPAEHLHISQPTLTRAMQKLEDEFGVPLFQRSKTSWNSMRMERWHLTMHVSYWKIPMKWFIASCLMTEPDIQFPLVPCAPMPLLAFVQKGFKVLC